MDSSCRCAPDDNVQYLSHIFETVNLAARESEPKFLLYCNQEANMT
jgi:hypothetical protein